TMSQSEIAARLRLAAAERVLKARAKDAWSRRRPEELRRTQRALQRVRRALWIRQEFAADEQAAETLTVDALLQRYS
ncbi:MAG: hypothetical protein NZ518_09775, partial [Dehalococcoidia bacterium]|nr:hypothetical protein [Dehalococcoidia bacterium]